MKSLVGSRSVFSWWDCSCFVRWNERWLAETEDGEEETDDERDVLLYDVWFEEIQDKFFIVMSSTVPVKPASFSGSLLQQELKKISRGRSWTGPAGSRSSLDFMSLTWAGKTTDNNIHMLSWMETQFFNFSLLKHPPPPARVSTRPDRVWPPGTYSCTWRHHTGILPWLLFALLS